MYLMDCIVPLGFSTQELMWINHIRMEIEAYTLADISTIDGTSIIPDAFQGIRSNNLRTYDWPKKSDHITPRMLCTWQQALTTAFCGPTNGPSHKLRSPLGAWFEGHLSNWNEWMDPVNEHLHIRVDRKYTCTSN